jgi:hypothetical protein
VLGTGQGQRKGSAGVTKEAGRSKKQAGAATYICAEWCSRTTVTAVTIVIPVS